MSILARRVQIVTGKGGVGKTTVCAALALAAQKAGRRVLVCEITAQQRLATLLGGTPGGTQVRQVDERIWAVHVRFEEALREYGLMVLRFKAVYQAVFENRLVKPLLRAVPQLPEIVMLGKVLWHAAQEKDETGRLRWDQVIVDAPATGHALSLLGTPRHVLGLVSDGPLLRDLRAMDQLLSDPARTAVHIVTLAEEMPVNEAIELHEGLKGLQLPTGHLFLNGAIDQRFTAQELQDLAVASTPELATAREAAAQYGERQALAAHYETRLAAELPLPCLRLPLLPSDTLGRNEIAALASQLPETSHG